MIHMARSLTALILMTIGLIAHAEDAVLVDRGVLVVNDPPSDGSTSRADSVLEGGEAVTGETFIDAATFSFRLEGINTVSNAVLHLPLREVWTHGASLPMQVFAYADNGAVELDDFALGPLPVAQFDASTASSGQTLTIDLNTALNGPLRDSEIVGLRVMPALTPEDIDPDNVPSWRGIRIGEARLSFSPGSPGVPAAETAAFDGRYLTLPGLSAPGVGQFDVTLELLQNDPLRLRLYSAPATREQPAPATGSRSGMELLDCSAFPTPPGALTLRQGQPDYAPDSGLVDIPRFRFQGREYSARLRHISGSDPMQFSLQAIEADPPSNTPVTINDSGRSREVEPSRDMLPLCHGWVLIGDTQSNALVERNLITGETGNTYPFNATPDQLMLDDDNGFVFFTTQPRTERLYRLDLMTGAIESFRVQHGGRDFIPRDLARGENGNLFAILFDPHFDQEEDPPAEEGLWMGVLDAEGTLQDNPIPLESPIGIHYDPARQNVFLRTESNLATFQYTPATHNLAFVPGTDVPVGSGCTDFDISPNGQRLAYSCPQGNDPDNDRTSLIDMSPLDYFDADGEWLLDGSPISAAFSPNGNKLLATDGEKLYRFDVEDHLREATWQMNLPDDETVKRIRPSRDGKLLIMLMEDSETGEPSGTMHWMRLP